MSDHHPSFTSDERKRFYAALPPALKKSLPDALEQVGLLRPSRGTTRYRNAILDAIAGQRDPITDPAVAAAATGSDDADLKHLAWTMGVEEP